MSKDNFYIPIKGTHPCLCGHPRRVHLVEEYDKKTATVVKSGKCLGGTPSDPLSCDCPEFQKNA